MLDESFRSCRSRDGELGDGRGADNVDLVVWVTCPGVVPATNVLFVEISGHLFPVTVLHRLEWHMTIG